MCAFYLFFFLLNSKSNCNVSGCVQSILKPISFHNENKFAFVTSESNDVYKKYIFLWCFCCLSHLKYRFCYNFRFLRNIVNQRDLMARPKKTKSISEIQNTKWIEKEETTKSIKPIMEKSIVVNGKKRKFKIHSAFRTMALFVIRVLPCRREKKTHFGYVFRLPNFIHVFKIAPKNCIP